MFTCSLRRKLDTSFVNSGMLWRVLHTHIHTHSVFSFFSHTLEAAIMFECMWKTSSIFTGVCKFCEPAGACTRVCRKYSFVSVALLRPTTKQPPQHNVDGRDNSQNIATACTEDSLYLYISLYTPTPPPWPQPLQQPTVDSTADIPAASHLAVLSAFCKFYYYF